jgi:hypothetical protein
MKNYMILLNNQRIEFILAHDTAEANKLAKHLYGKNIVSLVEISNGWKTTAGTYTPSKQEARKWNG